MNEKEPEAVQEQNATVSNEPMPPVGAKAEEEQTSQIEAERGKSPMQETVTEQEVQPANSKKGWVGIVCILLAGILWGTTGIFSHIMNNYLGGDSNTTSFYRMLGAMITMAIYIAIRNPQHFRIKPRYLPIPIVQGVVTCCIFSLTYIAAIQYLGMSTAVILLYTSPIYVTIMSRILFKEQITKEKILALMINLVGCALTISGGSLDISSFSFIGILLGLCGGLCYAFTPICGHYASAGNVHPETATFYATVFALIALTILVPPWNYEGIHMGLGLAAWSLCCGFMNLSLPLLLYMHGMTVITEPSKGPILASVENISAATWGVLLFGEFMNFWKVLGIALVLGSIVIMNRKKADA